jgi:hypothetical protein
MQLKFSGTHQLLIHANYVNLLGGKINTIQKYTGNIIDHHHNFISFHKSYLAKQCHRMQNMSKTQSQKQLTIYSTLTVQIQS